jgi:toxin ParE1/3/4
MVRVVVASPADADTAEIVAYLAAKAGQRVAARYVGLFERLYDRLAEHPLSGALRPALGPHMRIGIVPPFIVIYEYEEGSKTVTIMRIVHGRRRISGRFLRHAVDAPSSVADE